MYHDDKSEISEHQKSWQAIAERMRLAIGSRLARTTEDESPENLQKLVEAARTALWFQQAALGFDETVEKESRQFS